MESLVPTHVTRFYDAIKRKDIKDVELLLKHTGIRVSMELNMPIYEAISGGCLPLIKLLACQPDVDVAAEDNLLLLRAARAGNVEVVAFLLTFPGVDPTCSNNCPVRFAAKFRSLPLLKFLMTIPGVDPTVDDNCSLRDAAANGDLDMVRYLASLPGVDATNKQAMESAMEIGHTGVVKFLQTETRIRAQFVEYDILHAIGELFDYVPQWTTYLFLFNSVNKMVQRQYATTVRDAILKTLS